MLAHPYRTSHVSRVNGQSRAKQSRTKTHHIAFEAAVVDEHGEHFEHTQANILAGFRIEDDAAERLGVAIEYHCHQAMRRDSDRITQYGFHLNRRAS